MVAMTGEDLSGERPQRLERREEQVRIALRFHGEEIAREKDQIGLRLDVTLGDAPQPCHRHERSEVRIGDLHDAERSLLSRAPGRVWRELVRAWATRPADHDVDL